MNPEMFDTQLDRLVDGELHGAEYREFVAALDREPQHWRRCALAFLEAQALRGELEVLREAHLASDALVETSPVTPAITPSATASQVRWWHFALAMAASFLFALPLGSTLGRWLRSSDLPAIAEQPQRDPAGAGAPDNRLAQEILRPDVGHQPLGNVQFVDADGRVLEIPYYDVSAQPELLAGDENGFPPELLQSLERAGHRVERQSGIVPVNLGNGSQAIMPAEHYRIMPAANRAFQ